MKDQLIVIVLIVSVVSCEQQPNDVLVNNKPNILMIVADDHGKDGLGCYGNPIIQTPNIDGIANDGIMFNRAFCTTASCSASRSVILSGLHNHSNGQYGHQHNYSHFSSFDTIKSLPLLLSTGGYKTARIGKYHVAPESVYKFDLALKDKSGHRNSVEMADSCKRFIEQSSPFFLYFCSSDPHRGGGFATELDEKPDRFGNKQQGYEGIIDRIYDPDDVLVPEFLPDNNATRAEIAQYYQAISRLDQGVGRLIKYLKDAGKYDNTLIIYMSDNGMAFPGSKTNLYEPGIQLPLIVKMPYQLNSGSLSNYMISWTDIAPTLLEIAGVNDVNPSGFQGRSFLSVLNNPEYSNNKQQVFASHTFHEITMYYPMRVLREDRYKLIINFAYRLEYPFASDLYASRTWQSILNSSDQKLGGRSVKDYLYRPKMELYDVLEDPNELNNLASHPQFQEKLEEMVIEIKGFQEDTNDPWILKWEYE
tara:strand:+ start:2604 stop:4034 length:1431 start_codon:yes stop_codon:yes gene_type:complete